MAHDRKRFLESKITKALSFSPIVGVLGQRQVGKTTLNQKITGLNHYSTMDDEQDLFLANNRPQSYLDQFSNTHAIDECQKAPKLFNALKIRVQNNKRPGQFLLSGSVRFTSRKAIQESLTGRIINFELLPLSFAESYNQDYIDYLFYFSGDLNKITKSINIRHKTLTHQRCNQYIERGGLPGICFLREESYRKNKFSAHIETLLQRDIQLIIKTTAQYDSLRALLIYLADNQGEPFNLKEAAQSSRLAQNTVKKILAAYEGLFLIRKVSGFGFRNSPIYFLEDQGLAHYLSGSKNTKNKIQRILFSQIFPNIHYSHINDYSMGYYETKSGSKIDLVFKLSKTTLGFFYEPTEALSSSSLRKAENYLSNFSDGKVIIFSEAHRATRIDKQILHLPLHWIY